MSNERVNDTLINIAVKKVLGKAHTSNLKEIDNETFPSNTQATTQTTFGESVPNDVDISSFYSLQSGTVEYIQFDVNFILGTDYDEDSYSGKGGSERWISRTARLSCSVTSARRACATLRNSRLPA